VQMHLGKDFRSSESGLPFVSIFMWGVTHKRIQMCTYICVKMHVCISVHMDIDNFPSSFSVAITQHLRLSNL
jgi:hypothetical protein